ncbi:MAG: hypothetical protein AAF492_00390 [Verrucomicrobiota bacterium]
MIAALIRKELSQHTGSICVLFVLVTVVTALIYIVLPLYSEEGSAFSSMLRCLVVVVPVLGLVLSQLLVVREYREKTQLFLDVLPVSRPAMLLTKFGLGLTVVGVYLVSLILLAVLTETDRGLITPGLLKIVSLRAAAFSFFCYAFCFMAGLLGRYRISLMIMLFVGMAFLDSMTRFKAHELGFVICVDSTFPFETRTLPVEAVRNTFGLGLLCFGVTLLMGLVREGEVATKLGERMSHREKVFIASCLVLLFAAVAVYDERRTKQPFQLRNAYVTEEQGFVTKIAPFPETEDRKTRDLAQRIATELNAVRDYLGLGYRGPALITYRYDLAHDDYQEGVLLETEGLLFRCNYKHSDFDESDFIAWAIHRYLVKASRYRGTLERKRWVLDGFPEFWMSTWARQPLAEDKRNALELRALYAMPFDVSEERLNQWYRVRDRLGSDIAQSLAAFGLKQIHEDVEEVAFQHFCREMLGVTMPKDFRALFRERRNPPGKIFERHFPEHTWAGFVVGWNRDLATGAVERREDLARLPRLTCKVEMETPSPVTRRVRLHLDIESADALPGAQLELRYCALAPFQWDVDPATLVRYHRAWSEEDPVLDLPDLFASGDRVYCTVSVRLPELKGEVIAGWQRLEMP